MLFDETAVKANIRNREGKRVFFLGKEDKLTPSARDYLTRQRIEILPGEDAAIQEYVLENGAVLRKKPEHMTHLHGNVLVSKTHPRIAFRGAMDLLESELLLCKLECPEVEKELGEILTLARNLIRWEVMEEPVEEGKLCGLTQSELRQHSHFPERSYSQPHFMPQAGDGRPLLMLNRCRGIARQAELAAVRAFVTSDGQVLREDILTAMNRMSSMLYILMIRLKAKGQTGEHRRQ